MTDKIVAHAHPFFSRIPECSGKDQAESLGHDLETHDPLVLRVYHRMEVLRHYLQRCHDESRPQTPRKIRLVLSSDLGSAAAGTSELFKGGGKTGNVYVPLFMLIHPEELRGELASFVCDDLYFSKLKHFCIQIWAKLNFILNSKDNFGLHQQTEVTHDFSLQDKEMFKLFIDFFSKNPDPESVKNWYDFILQHELGHIFHEHGPSQLDPLYSDLALKIIAGFFFVLICAVVLAFIFATSVAMPLLGITIALLVLYALGGVHHILHTLHREKQADLFSAQTSANHVKGAEVFFEHQKTYLAQARNDSSYPWHHRLALKALVTPSGDLRTEALHHGTASKRLHTIRHARKEPLHRIE
jgi:hypothetical protein